jgi:hypothetical protein
MPWEEQLQMVVVMVEILNPELQKILVEAQFKLLHQQTAEVSQSEAANADAAALKVKKRGRSASIMTSAKGVTKTSTGYSLGKT